MIKYERILNDIMDIFHGLMYGSISYSYDKLHSAMNTDICETFSAVSEDFVMNVDMGKEITDAQLKKLSEDLMAFGEEFEIKEAKALAQRIADEIQVD